MSRTIIWHAMCLATAMLAAAPVLANGTVTLSVDSSLHEAVVQPGDIIDWTVSFTVSQGDNQGLALVSVDLMQSATNPGPSCLKPADSVPTAMDNFSRPLGISNPGEHEQWTGYVGSQREALGGADLLQIGGAQNTFGQPGRTMGWNTVVETGVGQGGAAELLAQGSFAAPGVRGVYIISLGGAAANVLSQFDQQAQRWDVAEATAQTSPGSITFIVCPGDVTGNGTVDFSDLAAVLAAFGSCAGDPNYDPDADLDNSGCVDQTDMDIVLANYNTACN